MKDDKETRETMLKKLNEKNRQKYLNRKNNDDKSKFNEESLLDFEKIEKQLNHESSNE